MLDGAVAIFDGVHGVEAQSQMVWFQANKFNIPRIIFINKMDRQGASLDYSVKTINSKLNVTTLITQLPIGEADNFSGVIDLVSMNTITYLDQLGHTVTIQPILQNHPQYNHILTHRNTLLENISINDDIFMDLFLNSTFTIQDIKASIRRVIFNDPNNISVVLIGSGLKNKGIQPLMDSIIDYLPDPSHKKYISD